MPAFCRKKGVRKFLCTFNTCDYVVQNAEFVKFLEYTGKKMNNSKQLVSSTFYCPFITQAEDNSVLPIELNLHKLHL